MITKDIGNYSTSDYYETLVLYSSGYKLIDTTKNGERVTFYFDNVAGCTDTIKKYYANELLLKAQDMTNSIKTIKNILFRK